MHLITNTFSRNISEHFDAYFKQYKIATSYVELLLLIDDHEELSQKDLSERMNLAPSTITRFVQKLDKMGLVKKKKNGRIVMIRLSQKALKLIEELRRGYEKAVTELESKLGEKFVHTTEQLMQHGSELMRQS